MPIYNRQAIDRLYSCKEAVYSKWKIRASKVFQRYPATEVRGFEQGKAEIKSNKRGHLVTDCPLLNAQTAPGDIL